MFGDRNVAQVAVVVQDIETAKVEFARLFGLEVPPTIITPPGNEVNMTYRGKPSNDHAKLAFLNLPNTQFELIEPVGTQSAWYEGFARTGNGFHHIAYWVENAREAKEQLEANGYELIQRGDMGEGQYIYFGHPTLGTVVELLESVRTPLE